MRLYEPLGQPKIKISEVAGREQEPTPEFEFRQIVLDKVPDMQRVVDEWLRAGASTGSHTFTEFADVLMLEDTLGIEILSPDKKRQGLDHAALRPPIIFGQIETEIIYSPHGAIRQLAWIQLFPERHYDMYLEEDLFTQAVRLLGDRSFSEQKMESILALVRLKPERRGEVEHIVSFETFSELVLSHPEHVFTGARQAQTFLSENAAYALLHPEKRSALQLSAEQKRDFLDLLKRQDRHSLLLSNILRNAAILLAEDARVDSRGKIEITWEKTKMKAEMPLPARGLE